jgi:hypothetical protein
VLAFSVIKLENFRAPYKNSIETARLGSPSPQRHLRTFRTPLALPLVARRTEIRSYRGLRPKANPARHRGISNRELHLLEHLLTYRKQTTAPRSNRELSTNPLCGNSRVLLPLSAFLNGSLRPTIRASHSPLTTRRSSDLTGSPAPPFAKGSVNPSTFLPGTAQYVECDVTYSKQTTATFLLEATTAHRCFRVSYARRVVFHLGDAIAYRNPRA